LDPKGIPVKNPIHRHAVSSLMTEIEYGPGGSLDIVIQHEQPAAEKNKNWLPSPASEFYLFMRLYLPKPIAVAGKYAPPMLEMLE
jgi:hypothetical protein